MHRALRLSDSPGRMNNGRILWPMRVDDGIVDYASMGVRLSNTQRSDTYARERDERVKQFP